MNPKKAEDLPMIRSVILAALLVTSNFAYSSEVEDAAMRLKKAAVERTWNNCKAMQLPDERCKALLSAIHRQELSVISELQKLTDANKTKLNANRLSTEMADCSLGDYQAMVNCQNRLLERLKAALAGNTLVSGKN